MRLILHMNDVDDMFDVWCMYHQHLFASLWHGPANMTFSEHTPESYVPTSHAQQAWRLYRKTHPLLAPKPVVQTSGARYLSSSHNKAKATPHKWDLSHAHGLLHTNSTNVSSHAHGLLHTDSTNVSGRCWVAADDVYKHPARINMACTAVVRCKSTSAAAGSFPAASPAQTRFLWNGIWYS